MRFFPVFFDGRTRKIWVDDDDGELRFIKVKKEAFCMEPSGSK